MCVCVCVTGIHASKRRKEVVCLEGERTSAISLWAVRYAVGVVFCIVPYWLFCQQKQHTLISKNGEFTPPVNMFLILHL